MKKLLPLFGLAGMGLLLSMMLGALTNAINARVSPTYFYMVFDQSIEFDQVWRASIAEGVLEAAVFGVILSCFFVVGLGLISHARCSYRVAVLYLRLIFLGALAAWVVGGLVAMGIAALSPAFYRNTFAAPDTWGELLRYAWVGGSIWGIEIGGVVSLVIALVQFRSDWRSRNLVIET